MANKFNPKIFAGRKRIYRPVPGCINIQRLWIWDKKHHEYCAPLRGKFYETRRYEPTPEGFRRRNTRYFASLEEARRWQGATEKENSREPKPLTPKSTGPTLGAIYAEFSARKLQSLSSGTQQNYARYVRLYFQKLFSMPIRSISPSFIDSWLDSLRAGIGTSRMKKQRTDFHHELSVLRCILRFYEEYHDDPEFKFPLKVRHAADAFVRKAKPKNKDLPEDEFLRFRQQLEKQKYGATLAAMATVQYYQALRISEAAGLFFEDLKLNFRSPKDSSIRICRHVIYPRQSGAVPMLADGFKNAAGGSRAVKELYLFPQAFDALKKVFKLGGQGLIFGVDGKRPFSYRQIQIAYDNAFERAGLNYRGTHVLRHGGCRRVYNATGGDLAVAQQLLGNSDLQSTLVYAQRDKGALKQMVQREWGQVGR